MNKEVKKPTGTITSAQREFIMSYGTEEQKLNIDTLTIVEASKVIQEICSKKKGGE